MHASGRPGVVLRCAGPLLLLAAAWAALAAPAGDPAAAAGRPAAAPQDTGRFDILIRGGWVVDGMGVPPYRADIGIVGDRIVRVSRTPLDTVVADRIIDAEGLVVAPGFIDAHVHVDDLHRRPLAESVIRQGVTTVIYAADGGMPWPLGEYITELGARGHAPNIAFFAGHNTIRRRVMGTANRAPQPDELERMKEMVARAMGEGAIGLSSGLRYVPAIYSTTEEVIELARVAAAHGGIYAAHVRDEGAGSVESTLELIRIAREAAIPAQLTHHKLMGNRQWGLSTRTLALIDSARAEGLAITLDVYPYTATSTGIAALFPAWALAGGNDSLRARLADPELRQRIEQGIRETILEERGGGDLSRMQLSRVAARPAWAGRTFADIARERGATPDLDFAVALTIELQTRGGAGGVWHVVSEEDLRRILRYPWSMISSDGGIGVIGRGNPHPRGYGSFPRVLGEYVRRLRVLPLEEAIRKMTSLPAGWFGFTDRGRIAEGMYADITIFDQERVVDRATFDDPHRFPVGIEHVLVNGVPIILDGSLTGEKPGRVLRRDSTAVRNR